MVLWFLLPAFAYLLGSIPFGLLLYSWKHKADIRKQGSGNIGATNVLRQGGKVLGLSTLTLDMAKGAVPILLVQMCFGGSPEAKLPLEAFTGFCAFMGHLYPAYSLGKGGGKGVATAAGCLLVLNPGMLAASLVVFFVIVVISRRVSAGSLAAAAFLPVYGQLVTGNSTLCLFGLAVAFFVSIRHRENIKRIIQGTEPKIF